MKNNDRRPQRSFADGVAQLNQEAAGLFRVEVIRPEDHATIAYALLGGDKAAAARVNAILESQRFIEAMAKGNPAICLTCPNPVTDPNASLALIVSANDAPTVALCSALCPRCSTGTADAVLKRAAAGYQATWLGLQCVEITHPEGGRA